MKFTNITDNYAVKFTNFADNYLQIYNLQILTYNYYAVKFTHYTANIFGINFAIDTSRCSNIYILYKC